MLQLHSDPNFHYEALRALATARYHASDIAEILSILPRIAPGNFDDWFNEWHNLGRRVLSTIDPSKPESSYSAATLRDVYFRASHYFYVADFFLHGNPADPRGEEAYELWRKYFDEANALLPIPGQHVTVKTVEGWELPVIIYRADQASAENPRPTLVVGGGFDSNYEEIYHVFGVPALERGYNVVVYEGPGQPGLIHRQKVGFVPEWEKIVTPIVDYIFEHAHGGTGELSFIDTSKIGLIGYSLGGYLAARAAAFEPRLAAVICIDGVWSFAECCAKVFPESVQACQRGDVKALTESFESVSTESSTNDRWFHDHLKYSFCTDDINEIFTRLSKMTLEGVGVEEKINMPAFIGKADEDIFFFGQPERVVQEIGDNATLFSFTSEQAATAHCQSGALVYLNQSIYEWFAGVVGKRGV